jgi:hypothetical protein
MALPTKASISEVLRPAQKSHRETEQSLGSRNKRGGVGMSVCRYCSGTSLNYRQIAMSLIDTRELMQRSWCKPVSPAPSGHCNHYFQRLCTLIVENEAEVRIREEMKKGCDTGYAPAASSCEGANNPDTCTVTALDVITAFAVPNLNCSSQSQSIFSGLAALRVAPSRFFTQFTSDWQ